jgi:hypothetical protein
MNKGLWLWPSDPKAQRKVLMKVSSSPHLIQALTAISKSKEGLANSELDYALSDNSNWMTVWIVRQLTALGFIELKVDFFGEPARYRLTELGRNALSMMTGQPAQAKAQAPAPAPAPQPVAPKVA